MTINWQASPLGQRWLALPSRDRVALLLLAGFVLMVVLYVLAWLPVQRHAQQASEDFQRQRSLNALIMHNAPAVTGRPVAQQALQAEQLQGLLTASAQAQGIRLQRLDVQQPGWIELQVERLAVTTLFAWLAELEARGVVIEEVGLTRVEPGIADVRLALSAGGF